MSGGHEGDESLAERWQRLDRESLAEARAALESGRRFHWFDFARAPLTFLRTLVIQRSFLDGTPGLIRAGLNAIHSFVTHLRIWAIEHDVERTGEPHEERPIVHRNGSRTTMVRPTWHDRLAGVDLYTAAQDAPRAPGLAGRGDLRLLELDGVRLLCKRMQHGGLLGWLLGDRYLDRRKPLNEMRIVSHARAHGVPTAEVPAVITVQVMPPFYRYWVFSQELPGAVDLLGYLRTRAPRAERVGAICAAARAVRAMHDAGLLHADLHLKNILVRLNDPSRPEAFIIDFDKAALAPHMTVRQRFGNLRRLWKSAEKARAAGFEITRSDMFRFLVEYAGAGLACYRELAARTPTMRWHRWRYRHDVLTTRPK